MTIFSS